jgi:hypothetical protein
MAWPTPFEVIGPIFHLVLEIKPFECSRENDATILNSIPFHVHTFSPQIPSPVSEFVRRVTASRFPSVLFDQTQGVEQRTALADVHHF